MQEQKMMHTAVARERTILKNVYLWMTAGLGLSGLIAWFVAGSPALLRAMVGPVLVSAGLSPGSSPAVRRFCVRWSGIP